MDEYFCVLSFFIRVKEMQVMNKNDYFREIPVIVVSQWKYDKETGRVIIFYVKDVTKAMNIRLNDEESKVFMQIDNLTRVEDIISKCGLNQEKTLSILKDFEEKDIISYRSRAPLIW
jgi:hypothetical protein